MKVKLVNKYISPNWEIAYLNFKLEDKLDYKAGQFIMFQYPSLELIQKLWDIISEEEKQKLIKQPFVKRAYSIASALSFTKKSNIISFYVKKAGAFSTFLIDLLKEGEELEMIWPYGKFIDEWENKKYLFVSVGSGLAPILSLYDELVGYSQDFEKIVNLHWDRYLSNFPDIVLDKLKVNNEKISNLIYLSREENISKGFEKWHVQDWLDKALEILNDKNISVFICGKNVMVDDVRQKLIEKWISENNIKVEKYW